MNPWLSIPLSDYEGHMASPDVEQAQLIASAFAHACRIYKPISLAMAGCAGGNGLEILPAPSWVRVVAFDINPDYVSMARERFAERLLKAEFLVHDIESKLETEPVDMVFAALLFEYVDVEKALSNIHVLLKAEGVLVAMLQLPSREKEMITPSPYTSLQSLGGLMRLVPEDVFVATARKFGFGLVTPEGMRSPSGKDFALLTFEKLQAS